MSPSPEELEELAEGAKDVSQRAARIEAVIRDLANAGLPSAYCELQARLWRGLPVRARLVTRMRLGMRIMERAGWGRSPLLRRRLQGLRFMVTKRRRGYHYHLPRFS